VVSKIFIGLGILIVGIVFLVIWPRRMKLAPELIPLESLPFSTSLERVKNSDWDGLSFMSRRIDEEDWISSGPFSDFKLKKGSPTVIDYLRVDAIFAINSLPSVIVGRLRDRGSGMHGWYVVMLKQGDDDIDFKKTQRYKVWIEKDPPDAIGPDGVPVVTRGERWFFSGLSDAVGDDYYRGYP
jgi:hypothetical protein